MLALESKTNCHRILRLQALDSLVEALEIPLLMVNAVRFLRNLCTYSGAECFYQLKGAQGLSAENKLQEVMVGLAAQVFKHMTSEESSIMFDRAGIKEEQLAEALVKILQKYYHPSAKTTAELESFNIFSGTVGLSHHSTTTHSLVETALKLLRDR
ncbi:hypothetical protein CCACVL1_06298 [Corchorus capsularis]|uniref:Armadillo-like helical n=1 Tax=Corchorus capsularis TaxID=210143 RepID=A0A1R3JGC0_COCAP|nr:hypothetical protein CCACVL1_06298 [Corchorus capsularis]